MSFAELAAISEHTPQFQWLTPGKKFQRLCPLCARLLKIALIGDEAIPHCSGGCAKNAILQSLAALGVGKPDKPPKADDSKLPPVADAPIAPPSLRDAVSWKIELMHVGTAALAQPGVKKWRDGMDRSAEHESVIGDLKFAVASGKARYQPPAGMSAEEIEDAIKTVAEAALDEVAPDAPRGDAPLPAAEGDIDAALPPVAGATQSPGGAIIACAADIQPEAIEWLWPGRFALGKVGLVVGDPGQGKSFLTLDLIARLSHGRAWPDGAPNVPPASAILLSAEDGAADTIVPRLAACGADLTRVHILTAVRHGATERLFSLQDDLLALERVIVQNHARLVIIDPLSAYLGGADSHKNSDTRAVLAPLASLAERHRVAIVGVSHLNKSEQSALYRVSGSLAFVAAARAVYVVAADRETGERKILARLKNNLARAGQPCLAFGIVGDPPAVAWEAGSFDVNLSELLAPDLPPPRARGPEPEKRDKAEDLIFRILGDGGRHPCAQVIGEASAADIAYPTLDRAAKGMGVSRQKDGFGGGWTWQLPPQNNLQSSASDPVSPDNLKSSANPLGDKGFSEDCNLKSSEDFKFPGDGVNPPAGMAGIGKMAGTAGIDRFEDLE